MNKTKNIRVGGRKSGKSALSGFDERKRRGWE